METLNLTLPKSWAELSDKQLRYLFYLHSCGYQPMAICAFCLFRWGGMSLVCRVRGTGSYIVKFAKKEYQVSIETVTAAATALSWIEEFPDYPVRLAKVGGYKPLPADFAGVPFETFVCVDNLYQGYLHTQDENLLLELAKLIYSSRVRKISREEGFSLFWWVGSLKIYLARMFPNFLQPPANNSHNLLGYQTNIGKQVRDSMNAQIRALTKGDVTKEKDVLAMDCHRALTELDALAKEYQEFNLKYGNK